MQISPLLERFGGMFFCTVSGALAPVCSGDAASVQIRPLLEHDTGFFVFAHFSP
jgi:hypothetical protein